MPSIGNLADLFRRYPAAVPPAPPSPSGINDPGIIAYREFPAGTGTTAGQTLIDASFPLQPVTIHCGVRMVPDDGAGGGSLLTYFLVQFWRGGLRHAAVLDGSPAQSLSVTADRVQILAFAPAGPSASYYGAIVRDFSGGVADPGRPRVTFSAAPALGGTVTIDLRAPLAGVTIPSLDLQLLKRLWVQRQTPGQTGFIRFQTNASQYNNVIAANAIVGPIEIPQGTFQVIVGNDAGQNQGNMLILFEYGQIL